MPTAEWGNALVSSLRAILTACEVVTGGGGAAVVVGSSDAVVDGPLAHTLRQTCVESHASNAASASRRVTSPARTLPPP